MAKPRRGNLHAHIGLVAAVGELVLCAENHAANPRAKTHRVTCMHVSCPRGTWLLRTRSRGEVLMLCTRRDAQCCYSSQDEAWACGLLPSAPKKAAYPQLSSRSEAGPNHSNSPTMGARVCRVHSLPEGVCLKLCWQGRCLDVRSVPTKLRSRCRVARRKQPSPITQQQILEEAARKLAAPQKQGRESSQCCGGRGAA